MDFKIIIQEEDGQFSVSTVGEPSKSQIIGSLELAKEHALFDHLNEMIDRQKKEKK